MWKNKNFDTLMHLVGFFFMNEIHYSKKLEILSLDLGFDVEIQILSFNSLKDFKCHSVCSKSKGTGC
jgi:hypothetical protein